MVDVYDTAFVIKQVTNGIQGDYQPPTNVELLNFVQSSSEEKGMEIPFSYAPAVFSRDLLENDFKKNLHCYEWTPDERAWDLAKEAFRMVVKPYLYGSLMPLRQAVLRMDKTTSPGYPLNLKYRNKGSAWEGESKLIEEIVDQVIKTGKFDVMFEHRSGKFMRWNHIYYLTSPKGELRTVDKLLAEDVSKRKTRTFMCGDLVLYLITVMTYGLQHDNFLKMADKAEWSAVGMSPWYGGWNRMAAYLSTGPVVTPNFHCFDVKHMEASVNDLIQTVIDATRNEGLLTYSRHMLEFIHLNDISLYVIGVSGWLYLLLGKNPSGKFLTADDNTLALILGLLYVIACDEQNVQAVLETYFKSPAKLFGDDSIIQDRAWVSNVIPRMRDLGFEFGYECPVGPLRDARFLNAGFHWSGTTWYFEPNFEKLRASIFFLWKSRSWRLAYVKVCAYRQLVYPYVQYRQEADRLLKYITDNHDHDMRDEIAFDSTLTYGSTRLSLMSDRDSEFLHTGFETTQLPSLAVRREMYSRVPRGMMLTYECFGVDLRRTC